MPINPMAGTLTGGFPTLLITSTTLTCQTFEDNVDTKSFM